MQEFISNNDWVILNNKNKWEEFSGIRIIKEKLNNKFNILRIETKKKYWIECTLNHILFYNDDLEVEAEKLKIGDYILVKDGLDIITSIKKFKSPIVYDIIGTSSNLVLTNRYHKS